MDNPRPPRPDSEVLPDAVADRLLARASELDAARRSGAALSQLRAAATEAGISAGAFDAAVEEMRGAAPVAAPVRRQRHLGLGLTTVAFILVVAGWFMVRQVAPSPAAPAMMEQAVVLRCLPAADAAELVRPLLTLPENTLQASTRAGSRVLTVRATPGQWQRVRALLDRTERAMGSCPTAPAQTGPR